MEKTDENEGKIGEISENLEYISNVAEVRTVFTVPRIDPDYEVNGALPCLNGSYDPATYKDLFDRIGYLNGATLDGATILGDLSSISTNLYNVAWTVNLQTGLIYCVGFTEYSGTNLTVQIYNNSLVKIETIVCLKEGAALSIGYNTIQRFIADGDFICFCSNSNIVWSYNKGQDCKTVYIPSTNTDLMYLDGLMFYGGFSYESGYRLNRKYIIIDSYTQEEYLNIIDNQYISNLRSVEPRVLFLSDMVLIGIMFNTSDNLTFRLYTTEVRKRGSLDSPATQYAWMSNFFNGAGSGAYYGFYESGFIYALPASSHTKNFYRIEAGGSNSCTSVNNTIKKVNDNTLESYNIPMDYRRWIRYKNVIITGNYGTYFNIMLSLRNFIISDITTAISSMYSDSGNGNIIALAYDSPYNIMSLSNGLKFRVPYIDNANTVLRHYIKT